MVRVLNVAEKPSIAKEISAILGGPHLNRRDSVSQYNPVFEFAANAGPPGGTRNCDMRMTSVLGHLCENDFQEPYRTWGKRPESELFTAPIIQTVSEKLQPVLRNLEKHVVGCDWLVLWLDCDREGEAIAVEVRDACLAKRPNLRVLRAKFSSLNPHEIEHAVTHLGVIDERLAQAVLARSEIDLRLGAAFTRFQTMSFRSLFGEDRIMLSYGPCQFPTLGFVVDRYLEIVNFVPEAFWVIQLKYMPPDAAADVPIVVDDEEELPLARQRGRPGGGIAKQNKEVDFEWERGRLFDQLPAIVLYEMVVDAGRARIIRVDHQPRTKHKPIPLSTVELQKRASRFLRLSGERTMKAAEELYQKGALLLCYSGGACTNAPFKMISYPRTETEKFNEGTDLIGLIRPHVDHPTWGAYARKLLDENGFRPPRAGPKDDQAHPPIHPTMCVAPDRLQGDLKGVYELVTRMFLAACSDDAYGAGTVVTCAMGPERFIARGLVVLERNYLDIMRWERWDGNLLPDFTVGQEFVPSTLQLRESTTHAPPLLSESDLIAIMDDNGIGTDATIAEHIATVQTRQYVQRVLDNRFAPTNLGLALIVGYSKLNIPLGKPYLRAAMERDCKLICEGTKTRQAVVADCLAEMRKVFDKSLANRARLAAELRAHLFPDGGPGGGLHDALVPAGAGGDNDAGDEVPDADEAGVGGRYLAPQAPAAGRGRGRGAPGPPFGAGAPRPPPPPFGGAGRPPQPGYFIDHGDEDEDPDDANDDAFPPSGRGGARGRGRGRGAAPAARRGRGGARASGEPAKRKRAPSGTTAGHGAWDDSRSGAPRGRGGGGGGTGFTGTCFKCQQQGHMSSSCPNR